MSCNIDIPRSLKSRDSLLRKKFRNRAMTSCRLHYRNQPSVLSSTPKWRRR